MKKTAGFILLAFCLGVLSGSEMGKWRAWGNGADIRILPADGKMTFLRLADKPLPVWNTPILTLHNPVALKKNTVLKFKVRADRSGNFKLNLFLTDKAEYHIDFQTSSSGWRENLIPLAEADYKRFGGKSGNPETLPGRKLAGIQFAYQGREIALADMEFLEMEKLPESGKIPVAYHGKSRAFWEAWSNDGAITISPGAELSGGKTAKFVITTKNPAAYNTPLLHLPEEVRAGDSTAIRFKVLTAETGTHLINVRTNSGEQEYHTVFHTTANQWHENILPLKEFCFKRILKPGALKKSSISGSRISMVQLAYIGREISVGDFAFIEMTPADRESASRMPDYLREYTEKRIPGEYLRLKRNGIFPFGVITTVNAGNRINAELFGQTPEERREEDLRDIRSRGFNAYSNFVDADQDIARRLGQVAKFHLYLLETRTSSPGLHSLPDDSPLAKAVRACSSHPNLLGWYGQDEPVNSVLYLKNKAKLEQWDPGNAPFCSAFDSRIFPRELGPAMDVIMIDPYSLFRGQTFQEAQEALRKHAGEVAWSLRYCAGKRVWMICQTFSARTKGQNHTFRYPSPEEARFDVYNTLQAGANGFFFFLYGDAAAWLDGEVRHQEFDDTLVDAWGNGNPTTDALGAVGKRLTAIMPSFLERRPMKNSRAVRSDCAELAIRQWDNGDGVLLIAVNRNLRQKISGILHVTPEPGEKLYDLDTLAELPSAPAFSLIPGDAKLLFLGTPQAWRQVETEIRTRHARNEKEIAEVTLREPSGLASVRAAFGEMNAFLTRHGIIEKIDGNAEWSAAREKIKALSRRYFEARRQWRKNGREPSGMRELETEVRQLFHAEKKRLSGK